MARSFLCFFYYELPQDKMNGEVDGAAVGGLLFACIGYFIMTIRRRVLSDEELRGLDGLEGLDRRIKIEALKEVRRKRAYGGGYRESVISLILPDERELDESLKGKIVPYKNPKDGSLVKLPLKTDRGILVMPFMTKTGYGSDVYTIRYNDETEVLKLQGESPTRTYTLGFVFCRGDDMGHMYFDSELRGRGLSLPAVKIATDHAMAKYGFAQVGHLTDDVSDRFTDLFERAGYKAADSETRGRLGYIMKYAGGADERDNLSIYYRFMGTGQNTGGRESIYRKRQ
jgi:hypothetical protein